MSARHASTRGVKISSFKDALDLVFLTDTDDLSVKLSCHLDCALSVWYTKLSEWFFFGVFLNYKYVKTKWLVIY